MLIPKQAIGGAPASKPKPKGKISLGSILEDAYQKKAPATPAPSASDVVFEKEYKVQTKYGEAKVKTALPWVESTKKKLAKDIETDIERKRIVSADQKAQKVKDAQVKPLTDRLLESSKERQRMADQTEFDRLAQEVAPKFTDFLPSQQPAAPPANPFASRIAGVEALIKNKAAEVARSKFEAERGRPNPRVSLEALRKQGFEQTPPPEEGNPSVIREGIGGLNDPERFDQSLSRPQRESASRWFDSMSGREPDPMDEYTGGVDSLRRDYAGGGRSLPRATRNIGDYVGERGLVSSIPGILSGALMQMYGMSADEVYKELSNNQELDDANALFSFVGGFAPGLNLMLGAEGAAQMGNTIRDKGIRGAAEEIMSGVASGLDFTDPNLSDQERTMRATQAGMTLWGLLHGVRAFKAEGVKGLAKMAQDIPYDIANSPVANENTLMRPSANRSMLGGGDRMNLRGAAGDMTHRRGAERIVGEMAKSGAFANRAERTAAVRYWQDRGAKWVEENPGARAADFYDQISVDVDKGMPEGSLAQREFESFDSFEWKDQFGDQLPTRVITGKNPLVDPSGMLTTTLEDTAKDPAYQKELLDRMKKTDPALRKAKNLSEVVDTLGENLMHLYENSSDAVRQFGKLWYDGGNKIANRWGERYGKTPAQMAGIIAVNSPQTDWFKNLSRAERIADILTNHMNDVWTPAMTKKAQSLMADVVVNKKKTGEKRRQIPDEEIAMMEGRSLAEIDDIRLKARFIRIFDEVNNPKVYRSATPDGRFGDFMKTGKGAKQKMSWANYGHIEKSILIWEDGSLGNISKNLGDQHKVRNFYNNIVDPNSQLGHYTSDTHNAAAGHIYPLAGSDSTVKAMLGGAPSQSNLGYSGTYPVYHQAGIEAAMRAGVLPREMQSITWETIRSLFNNKSPQMKAAIRDIWKESATGKITRKEALERIWETTGGVPEPTWVGDLDNASEWRSSYKDMEYEAPAKPVVQSIPEKQILLQGLDTDYNGWYDRAKKTIGLLTKKADFKTAMHESFHAWTDGLTQAHKDILTKHFGEEGSVEWFEGSARAFERYVSTGQVVNNPVKRVFDDIKAAIKRAIKGADGTPEMGDINPEVRQAFDEMLGRDGASAAKNIPADAGGIRMAPNAAQMVNAGTYNIAQEVKYDYAPHLPKLYPNLSDLPIDQQSSITTDVLSGIVPKLAKGIDPNLQIESITPAYGSWKGAFSPNVVIKVKGEQASVEALRDALGAVGEQGGVFTLDFNAANGAGEFHGVMLSGADGKPLPLDVVEEFANANTDIIGGSTRLDNGDLFGSMTKEQAAELRARVNQWLTDKGMLAYADEVNHGQTYYEHDWDADATGGTYLQRLKDGRGTGIAGNLADYRETYANALEDAFQRHSPGKLDPEGRSSRVQTIRDAIKSDAPPSPEVLYQASKKTPDGGDPPSSEPTFKRSSTFKEDGTYDVTYNGRTGQIARDDGTSGYPGWYLVGDGLSHFVDRQLGFTKADAIRYIKEGNSRWMKHSKADAPEAPAPKVDAPDTAQAGAEPPAPNQSQVTDMEPTPPSETALANRITAEIRLRNELGDRTPPSAETMKQWAKEAESVDVDSLIDRIESADKATATAPETLALGARISEIQDRMKGLENEYRTAVESMSDKRISDVTAKMDVAREELVRTIEAGGLIGTEAARTMVARKALMQADFSFAGLIQKMQKEAKKRDKKVSKKDIAEAEVTANRISEREQKLADLNKDAPETPTAAQERRAKRAADLDKREADIWERFRQIKEGVTPPPKMRGKAAGAINIGKSAEYAPLIWELTQVKLQKGILKLDALYDDISTGLKQFDLEITKQDFIDALDGEMQERKTVSAMSDDIKARKALSKDIQKQSTRGMNEATARQAAKTERLEKTALEKSNKAKQAEEELAAKREVAKARREAMQAERKMQKETDAAERKRLRDEAIKKRKAEIDAKRKLEGVKAKREPMTEEKRAKQLQKRIDELNKQAADGSLPLPAKKRLTPLIEQLTKERDQALKNAKNNSTAYQAQKSQMSADRAAQREADRPARELLADEAQIARMKGKKADLQMQIDSGEFYGIGRNKRVSSLEDERSLLESQIKQLQREADEKIRDMYVPIGYKVTREALGIPRLLNLGLDMGAMGRQGFDVLLTDVRAFGKAVGGGTKAMFSAKHAEKIEQDFYTNSAVQRRIKEGLEIDLMGQHPEYFVSKAVGKYVPGYAGAERFHKTFQNIARNEMADRLESIYKLDETQRRAANGLINSMTGRSQLMKGGGDVSELLGMALTAPKMYLGQAETMVAGLSVKKMATNPAYRRLVAARTLKRMALITGMYELAQLTGNEFGIDPEGADFLKLTVNGVIYDLGGGYTPYYRMIAKMLNNALSDKDGNNLADLKPGGGKKIGDMIWDVAQYKISPGVQLPFAMGQGTDAVGEPAFRATEVKDGVKRSVQQFNVDGESLAKYGSPLIAKEIYNMIKKEHYDRDTKSYVPGNEYSEAGVPQKVLSGIASFAGLGVGAYPMEPNNKFGNTFFGKYAKALNLHGSGETIPNDSRGGY